MVFRLIRALMEGRQPTPEDFADTSAPEPPSERPPRRPLDAAAEAFADASRDWLTTTTARAMEDWCLGAETNWSGDQASATLTLHFSRGTLTFPLSQIASFDPSDGTFLWADDNPSVQPDVRADIARLRATVRSAGASDIDFHGRRGLAFEQCSALVALAGKVLEFTAVYRGVTNARLSVFMGLHDPKAASSDGEPCTLSDLFPNAPTSEDRATATALVLRYCDEMVAAERVYCDLPGDQRDALGALERTLADRRVVYDRYWSRDDDFHVPASASHQPEYEKGAFRQILTFRHPDDGVVVLLRGHGFKRFCFHVRKINGAARIVDDLIDFGRHLMLG